MSATVRGALPTAPDRTDPLLDELRVLIARHARPDETTAIAGVHLSTAERQDEPRAAASGTVLAVLAQGAKRLAIGDRVHDYGPGQYLVASVDLPVTGHWSRASPEEPALGFGLVLSPATVAGLLVGDAGPDTGAVGPAAGPADRARGTGAARVGDPDGSGRRASPRDARPAQRGAPGSSRDGGPAPPGLGTADASVELLDAVVRMVRLLDHPADAPVLAPLIEREIVWRILTGPLGPDLAQIGRGDSTLSRIGRAARWITEHHAEAFRVDDLARTCAMSTSAFHRSFHAVTALSPIQFQKQIRLQRSRLLLMTGADDVATVGFRVGYESASQFSREYRRQFGAPPGRDAMRLRVGAGTG